MKKILEFYKGIHLLKIENKNRNDFISFFNLNKDDIKDNMMAIGTLNNLEIEKYIDDRIGNDKCLYIINDNNDTLGFITIGKFFDWNEITFYLSNKNRNFKKRCDNEKSFTDLVKLFLTNYFDDKNDDHILMWGTRYFAKASQHIANRLNFVKFYTINDFNEKISNEEIESYIYFCNKKIFSNRISKDSMNEYRKLIDDVKKSKLSIISDETFHNVKKFLSNKSI